VLPISPFFEKPPTAMRFLGKINDQRNQID